jgi:hypothetical protein
MTASLVPRHVDVAVYVVLDQLRSGRVWRELDEEEERGGPHQCFRVNSAKLCNRC